MLLCLRVQYQGIEMAHQLPGRSREVYRAGLYPCSAYFC
jgi:hypothetical protein